MVYDQKLSMTLKNYYWKPAPPNGKPLCFQVITRNEHFKHLESTGHDDVQRDQLDPSWILS